MEKNKNVANVGDVSTPFSRLIEEKRALDEKIVNLHNFLKNEEKASKIAGWFQVGQMREQLDVMLRYSGILNTRILTWCDRPPQDTVENIHDAKMH